MDNNKQVANLEAAFLECLGESRGSGLRDILDLAQGLRLDTPCILDNLLEARKPVMLTEEDLKSMKEGFQGFLKLREKAKGNLNIDSSRKVLLTSTKVN